MLNCNLDLGNELADEMGIKSPSKNSTMSLGYDPPMPEKDLWPYSQVPFLTLHVYGSPLATWLTEHYATFLISFLHYWLLICSSMYTLLNLIWNALCKECYCTIWVPDLFPLEVLYPYKQPSERHANGAWVSDLHAVFLKCQNVEMLVYHASVNYVNNIMPLWEYLKFKGLLTCSLQAFIMLLSRCVSLEN